MIKIKILFFFCVLFLLTESSYARLPWVLNPNGPYLCIHQEFLSDGSSEAYAFGVVHDSYDVCPAFDKNNPNNVAISGNDLSNVIFDIAILDTMTGVTYSHKSSGPKDPTCRFGVLYN